MMRICYIKLHPVFKHAALQSAKVLSGVPPEAEIRGGSQVAAALSSRDQDFARD
ncbi:MAG: hypothetical protein ACE5JX_18805 [Acidobacteriota bacterium]